MVTIARYFRLYDPDMGWYEIDDANGFGPTVDVDGATVFNTVDHPRKLATADERGFEVDWLPEDLQMRRAGQPTLFD